MRTKYLFFLLLFFIACKQSPRVNEEDLVDSDGSVLYFFKQKIDLGQIVQGERVKAHFKLQNRGKKDLLIHYVSASCGCTATSWETKPIKPNEMSEIEITFNSTGRHGKQVKEVYVSANANKNEKVLQFTCEVVLPNKSEK